MSGSADLEIFLDFALSGERMAKVMIGPDQTIEKLRSLAMQASGKNIESFVQDDKELDGRKTIAACGLQDKAVVLAIIRTPLSAHFSYEAQTMYIYGYTVCIIPGSRKRFEDIWKDGINEEMARQLCVGACPKGNDWKFTDKQELRSEDVILQVMLNDAIHNLRQDQLEDKYRLAKVVEDAGYCISFCYSGAAEGGWSRTGHVYLLAPSKSNDCDGHEHILIAESWQAY